ncbi:protocadherin gamma-A10-like [Phaenicophaeus curvirostris]|uniref:protocadherin gamma-A10-like n=1 Tax=Phaenicophaeus curvirostris TaxID=33595 RepID=UPI0037F0B7A3
MRAAGRRWGRRERALLWCVLGAAWEAAWGQLRYSVPEEMPKGSFVGDVAKDLALQVPALRERGVRLLDRGRTQYLSLHGKTGHLVTAERIDREQLCEGVQQCVLRCEVIVEGEMKVYEIEVEITDINDNAPTFRDTETELRVIETIAPGSRFPLRDAQDPDLGRNSVQSYELSGDDHFSLSVQAGPGGAERPELVLAKALDREEAASYELVLRAMDGGEPSRTGTARLRVAVLDANDNAPVFSQAEYAVRVPEDVPVGSTLVTLTATDSDEGTNGQLKYSFHKISYRASELFQLDIETGEISLKENLDFEEISSHELQVQAHDSGELFDTAKVVITVTDVNDNAPEISVRSALSEISEDAPPGTVVALLHVQDRDSGPNGEVRCSLDGAVPFRLQSSRGSYYSVVTSRELDREEVSEYNVTVRATDGGSPPRWSSAVLRLRVLDVNDNAPVFSEARYSARVRENNAAGALLVRVRARDADWGANARVRYRLCEGRVRGAALSSYVSLEAETGALYALRSFDYEEVREVGLWVRAEDGGSPSLSSNASVRLEIADENDNAPQVLYPPPAGAGPGAGWAGSGVELASRSWEPGSLVAKVVAVDADAGQNAWLSYELWKATEPGLFRVGPHSGEVRTARSPLARDASRHSLVVVVKDHGRPALSATATLTVVLAESVAELLWELGSAAAAVPGEPAGSLTRWLVVAVAAVSCLFLAFLLLLLALRLRRWRRSQLLPPPGSGALRAVPGSPFVGLDGVRAFLRSYSHEVSLTADSRKSRLRLSPDSACDTLPARPPPAEPEPLLDEDPDAARRFPAAAAPAAWSRLVRSKFVSESEHGGPRSQQVGGSGGSSNGCIPSLNQSHLWGPTSPNSVSLAELLLFRAHRNETTEQPAATAEAVGICQTRPAQCNRLVLTRTHLCFAAQRLRSPCRSVTRFPSGFSVSSAEPSCLVRLSAGASKPAELRRNPLFGGRCRRQRGARRALASGQRRRRAAGRALLVALLLEISEFTSPGARFASGVAEDPDVGSNSLQGYGLEENEFLAVEAKESPDGSKFAELVLRRALERERSLRLVLAAVEGGDPRRSGTAQLCIDVTDANDNAPVVAQERLVAGYKLLPLGACSAGRRLRAPLLTEEERSGGGSGGGSPARCGAARWLAGGWLGGRAGCERPRGAEPRCSEAEGPAAAGGSGGAEPEG